MIFDRLTEFLGGRRAQPAAPARERIALQQRPAVLYAIGDIHGRVDLLRALEAKIREDGAAVPGDKLIVQLGDFIDRGPHSAQVVDHLLSRLPPGWSRRVIAGNHEVTFCEAVGNPRLFETWLGFGGLETLGSYGVGQRELRAALGKSQRLLELVQASVPSEHLDFMRRLPIWLELGNLTFVHAGFRPGIAVEKQEDKDLLWYTGARDDIRNDDRIVIHGHEIVAEPEIHPGRINVDTGAYASGILSAVRLGLDAPPRIIQVSATGR